MSAQKVQDLAAEDDVLTVRVELGRRLKFYDVQDNLRVSVA